MAQLLPIALALPLALLCGGRLGRIAELKLQGLWLFFLAFGIQVVAFPFAFLPWTTGEDAAKVLWLVSYACLLAASIASGVAGMRPLFERMATRLRAIPRATTCAPRIRRLRTAAGLDFAVKHNSVAAADPNVSWLADRFAAPDWVPLTNVFSVGDAVIAVGAFMLVFAATCARVPGLPVRRRSEAPSG